MLELQNIYLSKVTEVTARLGCCDSFLAAHRTNNNVFMLEAAVLQVRKSLEATAFAAISPNRAEYESFRLHAEKPTDYRKDYNARAILQYLARVNSDFYPTPLLAPARLPNGRWHFERRSEGCLMKKQFETFYDRLGKYLHSDNPWAPSKEMQNLSADLPLVVAQLRALLEWHFTVIRTQAFTGVWVVHVPVDGSAPRILTAAADGDFVVER